MKINNNTPALQGLNAMHRNTGALNKSLEKLSSGLRINKAADDVAGMAISQKMRTQVQGLKQANNNAMDGISMIQTAEGSLNEVHDMLQRMRELSIQAANGTYGTDDREQIQKEIDHLISEINTTSRNTEFNTMPLLNGGDPITNSGFKMMLVGAISDANEDGIIDVPNQEGFVDFQTEDLDADEVIGESSSFPGIYDDARLATVKEKAVYKMTNPPVPAVGAGFTIDGVAFEYYDIDQGPYTGTAVPIEMDDNLDVILTEYADSPGFDHFEFDGKDIFTAKEKTSAGNYMVAYDGGVPPVNIGIQIGANANQLLEVKLGSLSSRELGLSAPPGTPGYGVAANIEEGIGVDMSQAGLNVTAEDDIHYSIAAIDFAIAKVSATRSSMGAYQNRLEHTVENLGVSEENMTMSLSQIQDTDMAAEMAEYTRTNVLTQSATAMLGKANELPNTVLQLIQA